MKCITTRCKTFKKRKLFLKVALRLHFFLFTHFYYFYLGICLFIYIVQLHYPLHILVTPTPAHQFHWGWDGRLLSCSWLIDKQGLYFWIVSKGCILIHVHFSLTIVLGEGILPYLPTLMEKLLLALSPSTVSYFLQVTMKEKNNLTFSLSIHLWVRSPCVIIVFHYLNVCPATFEVIFFHSNIIFHRTNVAKSVAQFNINSMYPCIIMIIFVFVVQTTQMKELAISAIGATGKIQRCSVQLYIRVSTCWIWVSYNNLTSNKHEWNNCFFFNAPKILKKLNQNKNQNSSNSHMLIIHVFVDHCIMAHNPWWLNQTKLSNGIIKF